MFVFHPFLRNATHKGLLKILDMQSLLLSLDVLYCAKSCNSSSVMTSGHLAHTSRTALRLQSTNSALHVLVTGATFQKLLLSFDFTISTSTRLTSIFKSLHFGETIFYISYFGMFSITDIVLVSVVDLNQKTFIDGLEKSVQPQGPI